MIENTHAMFRELSIERVGGKDRRRIGSLESFGGKGEIKFHCIFRDFSVNFNLQPLSCFFAWPENCELFRGWMKHHLIIMHPLFPLGVLKRKTGGQYFPILSKSISEVSKDHKEKPDLDPNLLKRSS